jgi:hypothetical protein
VGFKEVLDFLGLKCRRRRCGKSESEVRKEMKLVGVANGFFFSFFMCWLNSKGNEEKSLENQRQRDMGLNVLDF